MRGMPRAQTVYAATKAGLKALAEGIRLDVAGSPIVVSSIYPGFIKSEINAKVKHTPFMVDTETGCRALVKAIARISGHPDYPFITVGYPHIPLAQWDDDEIRMVAKEIAPQIRELLTRKPD